MRIAVWNCRMALSKKCALLYKLQADIAVVPECSREATLNCRKDGYSTCWWGSNKNKGLGVFAAKPWTIQPGRSPLQKWIAPVKVRGPLNFLLIAVWATQVGTRKEQNYVGQIFDAIRAHPKWFSSDEPVVICGDFNSNTIWDGGRKVKHHSAVVKMLSDRRIVSAYHVFFLEEHGKETRPTYYFLHKEDRPFHIDYIFVPKAWSSRIADFRIGGYREWRAASDHMPIVVDIAGASQPARD